MVELALRRKVSPKAVVQSFNYFFPSARTWGERIAWTQKELAKGPKIIEQLCEVIANGTFLPTDVAKDCHYCDYKTVCGDVWSLAANSQNPGERSPSRQ